MPIRRDAMITMAMFSAFMGPAAGNSFAQRGVGGQPGMAPAPTAETSDEMLLRDFVHYVLIDRVGIAKSFGEAILGRGVSGPDFVNLVDSTVGLSRFNRAVIQAQARPDVEDVAARLLQLYDTGKLEVARNADEIAASIAGLTGDQLERLYARERLIAAGEYAMPQLLEALSQRADRELQAQARQIMVEMGRQSIAPLAAALLDLSPATQELVVDIMGATGYATSLPFLYELHGSTSLQALQSSCERAIRQISGSFSPGVSLSDRFLALAEEFATGAESVMSFPNEDVQLLWDFVPGAGIVATPIHTSVFHEAVTMRLSERSLNHNRENIAALALWVAANLSREIEQPIGYDNPAYRDRREAMYYAVASGSNVSQRVLARAIDTGNTPLARQAIHALERVAGGGTLWEGLPEGRRPLLEALTYPNRRVQYEAALALAAAQPTSAFDGSDRVVPLLASAVRDVSERYAVVVAGLEQQPSLVEALTSRGYTVLPAAQRLEDIEGAVADAPGIDIVLVDLSDLPAEATQRLIDGIRARADLRATPILALLRFEAMQAERRRVASDQSIRIGRAGISSTEAVTAAEELLEIAVGPAITFDEAEDYRERALAVLRDLAVARNSVLDVTDGSRPLLAALADLAGPVRDQVAEVLSYVPLRHVQIALMDAVMQERGLDRIALMEHVASSARRFGNMLESRQTRELVRLASDGSDDEATAAAGLMGALNLPNSDLVPLILEGR